MSVCVGGCGREKPETGASYAGWRRGMCAACYRIEMGHSSTNAVRRWRSKPENRVRDNAMSKRWKDRNREANIARDFAYRRRLDVRGRCTTCGGPMGIGRRTDGICESCRAEAAREREERFIDLYNAGLPLNEIAALLGTTRASLNPFACKLRKAGRLGYRHAGWADRAAA